MNSVDIFIIIGIALFVVLGYRDGFFKKVFGILGFWFGFVVAINFMIPVSEMFARWFDLVPEGALVIAFFAIFLIIVVIVNVFYRWFGKTGNEMLLIKSRLAGALLGAAEGLVAVSLLLLMFSIFEIPEERGQQESILYKKTLRVAPLVFDYSTQWIPSSKGFIEVIKSKLEKFNVPR